MTVVQLPFELSSKVRWKGGTDSRGFDVEKLVLKKEGWFVVVKGAPVEHPADRLELIPELDRGPYIGFRRWGP